MKSKLLAGAHQKTGELKKRWKNYWQLKKEKEIGIV